MSGGCWPQRPAKKGEHRMPRDQSLTAATIPRPDADATQLFELLTVANISAVLTVSKSWVYEHTRVCGVPRRALLPHIKVGKYMRFHPQFLRSFLERRPTDR